MFTICSGIKTAKTLQYSVHEGIIFSGAPKNLAIDGTRMYIADDKMIPIMNSITVIEVNS